MRWCFLDPFKLNVKGHINLTGGEPLCSPHFYKILDEFKKDKDLYGIHAEESEEEAVLEVLDDEEKEVLEEKVQN